MRQICFFFIYFLNSCLLSRIIQPLFYYFSLIFIFGFVLMIALQLLHRKNWQAGNKTSYQPCLQSLIKTFTLIVSSRFERQIKMLADQHPQTLKWSELWPLRLIFNNSTNTVASCYFNYPTVLLPLWCSIGPPKQASLLCGRAQCRSVLMLTMLPPCV